MAIPRAVACMTLAFLIAAVVSTSTPSEGSLSRPTYSTGDRWVYILEGSTNPFAGTNASQTGRFHFDLVGRVDMSVVGSTSIHSGGRNLSVVRVDTRTTGFLNGTFQMPPLGSVTATGSFTTTATEYWEDQSYLTVQSNATTSYAADIASILGSIPFRATIRVNASTTIASAPPFELDVGQSAMTVLETHLVTNSTLNFGGRAQSTENRTTISSIWRREVLSRESVHVDAGTFSAYELNQSAGSFPGLSGGPTGGGNETAYYSNDTKNYVKRDAYANGTRVGELRLQSYSVGAVPFGLTLVDWLLIAVAVAVGSSLVLIYWRRRKKGHPGARSRTPPKGEQTGGSGDRTR